MPLKDITKFTDSRAADVVGLDRFFEACSAKLKKKREEGRGGWNDPMQCTVSDLTAMLAEHVRKAEEARQVAASGGDAAPYERALVDVANFTMMLWNRAKPNGD